MVSLEFITLDSIMQYFTSLFPIQLAIGEEYLPEN
jgi:hypothetical protein